MLLHRIRLNLQRKMRCDTAYPQHWMSRLQSVLNAATRLIFNLKRSDHITDTLVSLHWLRVPERVPVQYKIALTELQSSLRYCTAIPGTTHSCRWHTWSTSTPLCLHRSPGSTLFQTFHHRRPSFSGCRLTDLELTTRHSRFGINTVVVPAPIENFIYFNDSLFISTVIVVLQ